MDNIKIAMLAVSLLLNLYLISENRKQASQTTYMMQGLTAKMDLATKSSPTAEASANISDKALIDLVNASVRDEVSRAIPNDSSAVMTAELARIDQLQKRVDALQIKMQERSSTAGSEKEKKMREEAAKLKQEVLALCVKR